MINLKSMAENYVDPLSVDFDSVPYSPHILNKLEAAYLAGAQAILDKVRPVLEFYGDVEEWIDYKAWSLTSSHVKQRVSSHFDSDSGSKARALLEELKEK